MLCSSASKDVLSHRVSAHWAHQRWILKGELFRPRTHQPLNDIIFDGDYCQDIRMPEGFLLLTGLVRHFSPFQVDHKTLRKLKPLAVWCRKIIYGCSSFLCNQSRCFLRHEIQCSSCRLTFEQDVSLNCDGAICSGHAWSWKKNVFRLMHSHDSLWMLGVYSFNAMGRATLARWPCSLCRVPYLS